MYYLKKTDSLRKVGTEGDKLFLTINKPNKPVSSQTISQWLVKVIKRAHKEANKVCGTVKGHSTRALGPSWALFKGANLKTILESADWSQADTFIKFYLKNIQVEVLE